MAKAKKIVEVKEEIVAPVINTETLPRMTTDSFEILESFKGNINNKSYEFKKGDIVSLTKGELEVFGPYVKGI